MSKHKSKRKPRPWVLYPTNLEPFDVPANLTREQRQKIVDAELAKIVESLAQAMGQEPGEDIDHWRRVFMDIGTGGDGKVK